MWFMPAVAAALLWAVGQVAAKRGMQHVSPLVGNALAAAAGLCVLAPAALLGGVQPGGLPVALAYAAVAATLYQVMFYALDRGTVALTGTVMACYPLATASLSIALLGERLTLPQLAGALGAMAGTVLLAWPEQRLVAVVEHHTPGARHTWLLWGVVGAVLVGTGDFLAKVGILQTGVYTFMLALALAQGPVVALTALLDRAGRQGPRQPWRAFLPMALSALAMQTGMVGFQVALALGPAALVTPVSAAYVVLTAVLAVLFLHEHLSRRQGLGIGVAAGSIALIGLGSV